MLMIFCYCLQAEVDYKPWLMFVKSLSLQEISDLEQMHVPKSLKRNALFSQGKKKFKIH